MNNKWAIVDGVTIFTHNPPLSGKEEKKAVVSADGKQLDLEQLIKRNDLPSINETPTRVQIGLETSVLFS